MGKHEDADLILKLYDLRREAVMREARTWFFTFIRKLRNFWTYDGPHMATPHVVSTGIGCLVVNRRHR